MEAVAKKRGNGKGRQKPESPLARIKAQPPGEVEKILQQHRESA
jgi:hypothetical protein